MLEHRADPFENILNLSKQSLNTYNLLTKNLNFVPAPKQYSQKQLDTDTDNFFRLLKLKHNETQMSD